MKLLAGILMILFSCNSFLFAQDTTAPVTSVEAISFMEGTWEGSGWIMGKDRQRKTFSQKEIIQPKVHGQALVIDGLGYEVDAGGKQTDKVIHNAFGVISFNPELKKVTMITFSEMGGRMESELISLDNKKLQWGFKNPQNNSTIRFTEDFTEEGKWHETGEVSMDGKNWFKFFEMDLVKVDK